MIALLPHRVALLVPISYLLLALLAQATPLTAVLGAAKAQTQNFYLLAAPIKSSDDPAAEILDLINPFCQAKFMLRISGRSLYRQFILTSGLLSTWTMPPKQFGILKQYRSNVDPEGSVYFLQESGIEAQFSFQDKFLACNGDVTGFRNCPGDLSPVITYKGTHPSCTDVYISQWLPEPSPA